MAAPELARARRYVNQRWLPVAVSHACAFLVGILYVGWMILLVFCMDLLVHRGQVPLEGPHREYVQALQAQRLDDLNNNGAAQLAATNAGLLPTVVRLRDKWYAPALERLYLDVPLAQSNFGLLTLIFATALAIGVIRLIFIRLQGRLLVAATTDAQSRLQEEIFRKQFDLGGAGVDAATRERIGPLLTKHLPDMLHGIQYRMERAVREPVKIVALILFSLMINVPLTLVFVILSALAWIIGSRIVEQFLARGKQLATTAENATRRLLGLVGKHRLISAFGAEPYYQAQFNEYVAQSRRATQDRLTYMFRLAPMWQFLGLVVFTIVLALAGQNVLSNKFELSAAVGLFGSLLSVALPIVNIVEVRSALAKATHAARAIFGFLDLPVPPRQKQGNQIIAPLNESIDFDRVSYEDMDGNTVLSDISIRIHRGQCIGIVSKSDQERRAFVYLLARLLDPTEGRIKFDGIDIKRATLESLRAQVSLVIESDLLFPDTVAANIACGNSQHSLPQITESAKIAHAHNFIQRLPHGYECQVGDGGFPLKLGEAYRIALARAILRDCCVVCIEEPQHGLDGDTKDLIEDTMERFCAGRTVVVLPSRLSTLRSCDQIFLLSDGKLAAVGTHRELLETSELYRHLQYTEFSSPQFAS